MLAKAQLPHLPGALALAVLMALGAPQSAGAAYSSVRPQSGSGTETVESWHRTTYETSVLPARIEPGQGFTFSVRFEQVVQDQDRNGATSECADPPDSTTQHDGKGILFLDAEAWRQHGHLISYAEESPWVEHSHCEKSGGVTTITTQGEYTLSVPGSATADTAPGCYIPRTWSYYGPEPLPWDVRSSTGTVAMLQVGTADCGATQPPVAPGGDDACPAPGGTYSGPLSKTAAGSNWKMKASISADDGLVLTNVKLGARHMAKRISLPYFLYGGLGGGGPADVVSGFGELGTGGRARLVSFDVVPLVDSVMVMAGWVVEDLEFATGRGTCLEINQHYVFKKAVKGDHCEPTGLVPCARWYPVASYQFHGPDDGPGSLAYVSLPQRLHFMPDAGTQKHEFSAGALARDHDRLADGILLALATLPSAGGDLLGDKDFPAALDRITRAAVIAEQLNPLLAEYDEQVISQGQVVDGARRWDNYHQTRNQAVELPRGLALERIFELDPLRLPGPAPGCPECVHIHWRWGTVTDSSQLPGSILFPGFPDGNRGKPRVPLGSNQDVRIGVVKHKVERLSDGQRRFEEDPVPGGWEKLVNAEGFGVSTRPRPLVPPSGSQQNQMVLWYDGTGYQDADAFFTHGGFFSYDRAGPPAVLLFKPRVVGGNVFVDFKFSEWCRVTLEVSRVRDVRGAFVRQHYGSFVTEGDRSPARLLIPARNGTRRLKSGAQYVVRLIATDAGGNKAVQPVVTFTAP